PERSEKLHPEWTSPILHPCWSLRPSCSWKHPSSKPVVRPTLGELRVGAAPCAARCEPIFSLPRPKANPKPCGISAEIRRDLVQGNRSLSGRNTKTFTTRGKSFKALASHDGSSSIDKRANQAPRMIQRKP